MQAGGPPVEPVAVGEGAPVSKEVLIIQLQRMGDVIRTLPVMARIRQEWPDARVTLLAAERFSRVLRESPLVHRLVALASEDLKAVQGEGLPCPGGAAGVPQVLSPVMDGRFDLAVNLSYADGGAVLRDVKAREKRGFMRSASGDTVVLGDWARYIYAASSSATPINLFNLVDVHMGMCGLAPRRAPLAPPDGGTRVGRARAMMGDPCGCGADGDPHPSVFFQLGAYETKKAWPLVSFLEVGRALHGSVSARAVLVGSPQEKRVGARFASSAGFPVLDLTGMTEPEDLPYLLSLGDLLVSNDTAAIHAASLAGARVLGLYFATRHEETGPYGEGCAVLQQVPDAQSNGGPGPSSHSPPRRCITPSTVAEAALAILEGSPPPDLAGGTVALFRSRFLENGTLLYVPVCGSEASRRRFSTALLHRAIWERVLGLENDEVFLAEWFGSVSRDWLAEELEAVRGDADALGAECVAVIDSAWAARCVPRPDSARRWAASLHGRGGPLGTLARHVALAYTGCCRGGGGGGGESEIRDCSAPARELIRLTSVARGAADLVSGMLRC